MPTKLKFSPMKTLVSCYINFSFNIQKLKFVHDPIIARSKDFGSLQI